ncbi:hypothetical protein BP5796_11397 [Coleophoma crateriformis]|uniref:Uncharacterized protein n=1 Tax=Coleophoma crateriformis TaxID=565419 RepID=A0A3D8QI92_9HELO|nr:hypothetical protein BP5796_11397 [Coleophoma crateriformis]
MTPSVDTPHSLTDMQETVQASPTEQRIPTMTPQPGTQPTDDTGFEVKLPKIYPKGKLNPVFMPPAMKAGSEARQDADMMEESGAENDGERANAWDGKFSITSKGYANKLTSGDGEMHQYHTYPYQHPDYRGDQDQHWPFQSQVRRNTLSFEALGALSACERVDYLSRGIVTPVELMARDIRALIIAKPKAPRPRPTLQHWKGREGLSSWDRARAATRLRRVSDAQRSFGRFEVDTMDVDGGSSSSTDCDVSTDEEEWL